LEFLELLEAPHVVAQLYGVPHGILQVFIIILYENVFQNPELFPTQVSLSPRQSTLGVLLGWANIRHIFNIRIMNIFDLLFEYSNIIRSNILMLYFITLNLL
jgi:hypothetical protein